MGDSAVATRRAESAFGVADVAGLLAASVQPLDRSLPAGSAPNRCLRRFQRSRHEDEQVDEYELTCSDTWCALGRRGIRRTGGRHDSCVARNASPAVQIAIAASATSLARN